MQVGANGASVERLISFLIPDVVAAQQGVAGILQVERLLFCGQKLFDVHKCVLKPLPLRTEHSSVIEEGNERTRQLKLQVAELGYGWNLALIPSRAGWALKLLDVDLSISSLRV